MLRILLADDHASVRRSVRLLVERVLGFEVLAEARNGRDAVALAERVRPDVAILDISMPLLDGFDACVEIRRRCPYTEVVLFTAHHIDDVEQKALRAGAAAVVVKDVADADTALIAALEPFDKRVPVHLGGTTVRSRHIAALFGSSTERYRVLAPFVAEGLDRGEKVLHIADTRERDAHLKGWREEGVSLDEPLSTGQLELASWEDHYLVEQRFDRDRMARTIRDICTPADSIESQLRLVADMEWALGECPGVEELIEYESRMNGILAGYRDVVICAYDTTRFSAATILDVIRSHPAVIIGGKLMENSLYTPTDELVEQLHAR